MSIFRASSTSKSSDLRKVVSRLSVNPFWPRIFYFLSVSLLGFGVLKAIKPRTDSFKPRNLDLFFTSVSSVTVSSMSTVEMEVFSEAQLVVITILMFLGGEVFTSMTALFISNLKQKLRRFGAKVGNHSHPENIINGGIESGIPMTNSNPETLREDDHSRKFLSFVVLGYLLAVNLIGAAVVSLYISFDSTAGSILKSKGLKLFTFSVFTAVSSFTNCGFIPTNENMVVFRKSPGLLLIIIPQILLGNTLFPPFLRFSIWVLGKVVKKVGKDSDYLLKNTGGIRYPHLLPSRRSWCLVVTVLGFLVTQVVLFLVLEWNLEPFNGMNSFERIVGVLFQSLNARHAGETILDISTISAASLVLATVCMYLPPYATYLFLKEKEEEKHLKKRRERSRKNGVSNIAYLSIFVILVCITERENITQDPLNFNVFNIVLEVVSAYGSVGFTMGYSCKRRLKGAANCEDKWYGFAGRWSDSGKAILIAVMFFGRLKNFNLTWKLP
ncbi:high-affinity K+ transporter 1 [Hibiscus trionum]|uniref:High-affinity K+ transporter 1 n=1 Tax=Hibiscus trionum TaxID=183268 RepID=A0A9W7MIP6_HIBTR|nr:high-affinity K+ transporter 1 [Hibiscus trionum]